MTTNQLQYWAQQEQKRHNMRTEDETNRTNVANEAIKRGTLDETRRSNVVNEGIKRDTLSETRRSNQTNELIKQFANTLESRKISENIRHNMATEQQAQNELSEQTRYNKNKNASDYMAGAGRLLQGLKAEGPLGRIISTSQKGLNDAMTKLIGVLGGMLDPTD